MKMRRAYAALLRLYPADYRTRFAAEMVNTFEEAATELRKQGTLRSVHFGSTELLGLLIAAAGEWNAKLSTDSSVRGRSLPDLRMMRPPGVAQKEWFAGAGKADSRLPASPE